MQVSKSVYFSGRREDRADAMRTGIAAVRVVPWVRQADRKEAVVVAGMVRERKCEVVGGRILLPDQRPGRIAAGGEEGMRDGWSSSRLGMSGVFGDDMILVARWAGEERRPERKSLWNVNPEPPSEMAWWKMKDAMNSIPFSVLGLLFMRMINRQKGRLP